VSGDDEFDPFSDPRFPDRPTHPDFWRLSEIVLQLDGDTVEGGLSMEQQIEKDSDPLAVLYMSTERAKKMFMSLTMACGPYVPEDALLACLGVMWVEGFLAGTRFQQRGGKQ
jgi:hypothetical protein